MVGLAFAIEGSTLFRVTAAAAAAAATRKPERFTSHVVRSLPPLSHCVCVSVFPLDLPSRGSEERTALIDQRVDTTRQVRFYTSSQTPRHRLSARGRVAALSRFPCTPSQHSAVPFECGPRQGVAVQGIAAAPPASARPGRRLRSQAKLQVDTELGAEPGRGGARVDLVRVGVRGQG